MARIETDPNYTAPTFSRATAATDPFKKEDVQNLAAAVSTHDHSTGKGVPITAIPNGTITSAMIADATIDTADLKDGAVTSAKILDGTIATVDIANQAVTNAKLASDTARANLLTNGGFEIWQRGNGPFTVDLTYSADRWRTSVLAGTYSISRDTTNMDVASGVCLAVTTSGASPSIQIWQPADPTLKGRSQTFTFSIRARTATANAVRAGLYDGTTATFSSYHPGGGTYQTLTVTFAFPTGAAGVSVFVQIDAATTVYLDNAMLVVGNVAADYAPLHPADDLAQCLRYYEAAGATPGMTIAMGQAWAATGAVIVVPLQVQKAVTPTVTLSAAGTYAVSNAGTTQVVATAVSAPTISSRMVQINVTVAGGLVAGNATFMSAMAGQTAVIGIEANP